MANPKIKFKRSAVADKIPLATDLPLGEIALNTYDGKLYASKNVGLGTTAFAVNPWTVGTGTNTYNAYFTKGDVGIGSTEPAAKLDVAGITSTQDLYVAGISTFVGECTFKGGTITLGDANSDNVVFTSDVNSNIIPNTDGAYDLGSSSQQWRDVFINGTADIDALVTSGISTFSSNVDINSDVDINRSLAVTGGATVSGFSTFTKFVDINESVDIAGGATVTGLSTFTGNVDINSDVDINRSLSVTGGATVSGFSTFTKFVDINESVDIAGGATVTGLSTFSSNVDINSDVDINRSLAVTGGATVSGFSTFTKFVDINESADISGGLNVAGILTAATINATVSGDATGLTGSPNIVVSDVTATNFVGSAVTITGNLDVRGTRTIVNTNVLDVSDTNIGIASTASLLNDTNLDGAGITIFGSNGNKTLTWDGTNNRLGFNTDLSASNIFAGRSNITGIATFGSNVDINSDVDINRSLAVTGGATVSGLSTFTGNVDINSDVDINRSLTVTGGATVTGLSTFSSNVDINSDVDINRSLAVTGGATVTGLSTFTGNVDINSDVDINRSLAVTGGATVSGFSTFTKFVDINESVDIAGGATVTGLSTFTGNVDINSDVDINRSLAVTGGATVSGFSTFTKFVDINESVDIAGGATVTGLSTFTGNVDINSDVDINRSLSVTGGATVSGFSTFTKFVDINESADISGGLNVAGLSTFATRTKFGATDYASYAILAYNNKNDASTILAQNNTNNGHVWEGYKAGSPPTSTISTGGTAFFAGGATVTGICSIRNTNATSFNAGGDDLVIGNATDGQDAGMTLYSHSSDNGSIFFNDTADANVNGLIQYRHSEDAMRFNTAGTERFRITSGGATITGIVTATTFIGALTGNVTGNASGSSGSCTGNAAGLTGTPNIDCAIGTFTGDLRVGASAAFAGTPLEVEVTGSTAGAVGISLINSQDSNASATCVVRSYHENRVGGDIVFGRENANDWSASVASADGFISLNPAENGSAVEGLRITSDRKVGIGTISPESLLHLKGPSASTTLIMEAPAGQPNKIQFQTAAGALDAEIKNESAKIILSTGTSPTARLTLDSTCSFAGELGIGPNFENAATNASGIWLSDSGRTTFYHSSSESGNYLTCTQADGSGGSSTLASISGAGAATFSGLFTLDDTGANAGIQLGTGADFTVKRVAPAVRFNAGSDLDHYEFCIGGTEKITFTSGGGLTCVGQVTANGKLAVNGTGTIADDAIALELWDDAATTRTFSVYAGGDIVTSGGQVMINTSNNGSNAEYPLIVSGRANDATDSGRVNIKRGEAAGSMSAGDSIGDITFTALDGGSAAMIAVKAGTGWGGTSDSPGDMYFSTTPDGSGTLTERLRITSTGAWAIEGSSNYGTSGQVLTSNGNDSPTWQAGGGGFSAVTWVLS